MHVRYNTGLHISSDGHALDELLTSLTDGWPVPVSDIALVGHSMGGLVVRSACHYGSEGGRTWTENVRQVVCLGSPHLGADLEKGVTAASWALSRLRETRAPAEFLHLRSDDHLVRPPSASSRGQTRRLPFEDGNGLVLTGLHHFDLLNHPDVYDRLAHWLTPR